jgi:hypothetical protein
MWSTLLNNGGDQLLNNGGAQLLNNGGAQLLNKWQRIQLLNGSETPPSNRSWNRCRTTARPSCSNKWE